ncbi:MAG: DUF362 domain-containing protein [Sedimentisphaerales bacterium]|nr:DUF362 domain-containing protein [Sedimentisphaerales bacterium]
MMLNEDARNSKPCPKASAPLWFRFKRPRLIWLMPIVGLVSLVWFLIRVIPKPSRATYPCQRVAFPLASGFVVWLLGLFGSAAAFRKARKSFLRSRYILGVACMLLSVGCLWVSAILTGQKEAKAAEPHTVNNPIGIGRGVHPGRVVWVHDPNATDWQGPRVGDGYWWQNDHTDQNVVDEMMAEAIMALAGERDIAPAWELLFRYFNKDKGRGDRGYAGGEKIMIKVNFVDMISVWGNTDYDLVDHTPEYAICSPHVMHALLDHLVNIVGVAESDISIGDPICMWCNEFYDMIHPDFPDVRYLDYRGYYNRTKIQKSTTPFYWSTTKADGKNQDYVLQSYVDADYFINLASFKGHYNQAGITLCGKNHFGSLRGPTDSGYYDMHSDCPYAVPASGSYRDMVDLMGHRDVGGKTFLAMIDGLYGGKHAIGYPENLPKKWQMSPFNDDWPSSIFVSQDQVAIDSVGFDFLVTEWPEAAGPAHQGADDYLHEAALADVPPSGTFYDPERDGTAMASLGVHEHWNNPTDKQYLGNLGIPGGVELVKIPADKVAGDIDGDRSVGLRDAAVLSDQWLDCCIHSQTDANIFLEAEHFSGRAGGFGAGYPAVWLRSSSAEASGQRCMQAVPDSGLVLDANIETDSPRLSYLVNFTSPGTYYLWLKASAVDSESDTLHYGLDGTVLSTPGKEAMLNEPHEELLIEKGSDGWLYLDIGAEQAGWAERAFDDASWRTGRARLGYGDDGEITEVRFGPNEDNDLNDRNNKYITTYFRKHFTVDNPADFTSLAFSVLRDDGAASYLNGHELPRTNMPSGPLSYETIVRDHAAGGSEEDTYFGFDIDPNFLAAGDNVLSVEVHQYAAAGQNNITSSDLSLDVELKGATAFSWVSRCADSSRPMILISSAGLHRVDIWMREDGARMDCILLTPSEEYNPADTEPVESSHVPLYEIVADLNGDGVVDFADFTFFASHYFCD